MKHLVAGGLALGALLGLGAAAPSPYTGKYESGWEAVPTVELLVKQEGARLRASATLVLDHRGTRVLTADMEGRVASRGAHFTWQDSSGNTGVATLWSTADGRWMLLSRITKPTNEGRWFEGTYALTKTASSLMPNEEPQAKP